MNTPPELELSPISGDSGQDQRWQEIMAQLDIHGWRFWTGVKFPQPPHLSREVKTNFDHSTALVNAREYLELAGYHPLGSSRKKKFRKPQPTPQTLQYTRGATSHWELFLVPSPKNMRINVSVSGVPVDNYQHTLVQIDYLVELPAGVGVARPSCDFWIAEVVELENAIVEDVYDQTETYWHATRSTAYCLARNYINCGVTLLIVGLIPLWLLGSSLGYTTRTWASISILGLPLLMIGPPLLLLFMSLHTLLAIRLGR